MEPVNFTLYGKRDFACVIKLSILRKESILDYWEGEVGSSWRSCVITVVLWKGMQEESESKEKAI